VTKEIPLTQGEVTLVDDDLFEELNKYKWSAHKYGNNNIRIYAARGIFQKDTKKVKQQFIHRYIWFLKMGEYPKEIDHINHDCLDNRFENLRQVNRAQNQHNRRGKQNGTSIYKGVCWDIRRKRWSASICINYKQKTIGRFKTEIEAAKAYNEAAKRCFGEYASLNFI